MFGDYYNDFDAELFLEWCSEFNSVNNFQIPRAEGAGGYVIRKEDWDYIGGNDSLFAPVSYEDMDLFIRMKLEDFKFIQTTKSALWHFAGRGSHRLEENQGQSSTRQKQTESRNITKWMQKWGQAPQFDSYDFIKPIYTSNVKTRLSYDITNNTSY
jgi:GT2 family glycosyltransferase